MKLASIVGARPNFMKLAPLSKNLRTEFEELIIHTGQHDDYELDRIFFDELQMSVSAAGMRVRTRACAGVVIAILGD